MEKIKQYFKYVNQWNVMFYTLVLLQLALGWEGDHYDWNDISGALLIWALYMIGYNSLDRELEINLDRAKEAIANETSQA
jgi:hypothetical protein